MRRGFFVIEIHARTPGGERRVCRVEVQGDPGYGATSVMRLGESASALPSTAISFPTGQGADARDHGELRWPTGCARPGRRSKSDGPRLRTGSVRPNVCSARRRTDKRPGDATTSWGMAPRWSFGASPRYLPSCAPMTGGWDSACSVEVPVEPSHRCGRRCCCSTRRRPSRCTPRRDRARTRTRRSRRFTFIASGRRARRSRCRLGGEPHDVEVRASRDVLHDVPYGALIDAGERLADVSKRAWRGEPWSASSRAPREVLALDAMLRPRRLGGRGWFALERARALAGR